MLLVSWDTTRADALGCYQDVSHWDAHWKSGGQEAPPPRPRTPTADQLAADGVRFRWALSHAPTTLSSHTALLSGLDQHRHGVLRNGFPVGAEVELLPERFAAAGWHTVGVVGASVLESAMGLDRGFATYDDAVNGRVRARYEDPARRVVDRVFTALDQRPEGQPLFLFVHFFDAHSPWDSADADLREALLDPAYAGPVDGSDGSIKGLVEDVRQDALHAEDARAARALYLAEVATVDRSLDRLLHGLDQRGLLADSLVVLVGDHGEALEDARAHPYGHGPDVDLPLIHVPFILRGRGRFALEPALDGGPRVVDAPVSLKDVAPTLLGLAGLPTDLGDGRDLRLEPGLAGQGGASSASPVHFAEATKPFDVLDTSGRWPNLPLERAAVGEGHMLMRVPYRGTASPLYVLAPGQPTGGTAEVSGRLAAALAAWDESAPAAPSAALSPETEEALRSLGYLPATPAP